MRSRLAVPLVPISRIREIADYGITLNLAVPIDQLFKRRAWDWSIWHAFNRSWLLREDRFWRSSYLRPCISSASPIYVRAGCTGYRAARYRWAALVPRSSEACWPPSCRRGLRANSLSSNWVFSSAIRRPRYIYVGCPMSRGRGRGRREQDEAPTVIEDGWTIVWDPHMLKRDTTRREERRTSRIKHDNVWPMSKPWLTKALTSSLFVGLALTARSVIIPRERRGEDT